MNIDLHDVRLTLVDPYSELCGAWRRMFSGFPNTRVVTGRFQDLDDYDCLVSPANSFGRARTTNQRLGRSGKVGRCFKG